MARSIPLRLSVELSISKECSVSSQGYADNTSFDPHEGTPANSTAAYVWAAMRAFESWVGQQKERGKSPERTRITGISETPSIHFEMKSELPVAAGLSSSAALLVACLRGISKIHRLELGPGEIAEMAFHAEHDILGVPCGRMDQYSVSYERLIRMQTVPRLEIELLSESIREIVIVDSQIPKLTSETHKNIVPLLSGIVNDVQARTGKDCYQIQIENCGQGMTQDARRLLEFVVQTRDSTEQAIRILRSGGRAMDKLGEILSLQHVLLRDKLRVSLPLIDEMVEAATDANAYGARITGAGFGGSMIALSRKGEGRNLLKAIEDVAGSGYHLKLC